MDNVNIFKLLLTDLSKLFNCLSYEHLTAKLNGCGFSLLH